MEALLCAARARGIAPDYVDRLLEAFPGGRDAARSSASAPGVPSASH